MNTFTPLDPARFTGEVNGRPTALYTLRNRLGMQVAISNLGAKILQIVVPDRHGVWGDVSLGYESIEQVLNGSPSLGAFIGRYAGRIRNAQFPWDGVSWPLAANGGPHCQHGGPSGLRHQVLKAEQLDERTLVLSHDFLGAEDGFPGDLALRLVYRLSEDSHELSVEHEATALRGESPASFTCHAYFNLDGPGSDINHQTLQVKASSLLVSDAHNLATGERLALDGQALDLRQPQRLGELPDIDQAYVLDGPGLCARVEAPDSGRWLEVRTTEPILQVYGAGQLGVGATPDIGKGGAVHHPRSALCLEPQQYPNAVNCPGFPLNRVGPGRPYRATTSYTFGVMAVS